MNSHKEFDRDNSQFFYSFAAHMLNGGGNMNRSKCNSIKVLLVLIIIFNLVSPVISAQDYLPIEQWNITFGGAGNDTVFSVQQTSDGGYIVAGETRSYGAGDNDVWIIKTDANGKEQWNRTFGGTGDDGAMSAQQTSDGGYILAGKTASYGAGGYDVWLIKTNASGNRLWNKIFGGQLRDEAYSVQQTSDGGYILAGKTASYGYRGYDAWLIKTDSNGNEQWNVTDGGFDEDIAWSVRQTLGDRYTFIGTTKSFGAGNYNYLLTEYDKDGNRKWGLYSGGASYEAAVQLNQTSEGGYILAGAKQLYGAEDVDAWLIKTNTNGYDEWDKTFGGTSDDRAWSVHQTSDGGYILAGQTNSYGAGGYDSWLIKTDASGNEQWNKTLGGRSEDIAYYVQQTSDRGYILAGKTNSHGAGKSDAWLIKVSLPAPTPTPTTVLTATPTPINLTPTLMPPIEVTPTPKMQGFEAMTVIAGILTIMYLIRREA